MSKAQLELPISFEVGPSASQAGAVSEKTYACGRTNKSKTQDVLQPSVSSSAAREFLTCAQVCARYKVSRQTIWRWVKSAGFPAPHQFSSRALRWALDELEAFEDQLGRGKREGIGK